MTTPLPHRPEDAAAPPPLLYKPEEAAARLNISRSKLFLLIQGGEIETVQIGRSRRVPAEALADYVARLRQNAGAVA